MELIETHAHLPALTEKPLNRILSDAAHCGVTRIICIGASDGIQSAPEAVALAEKYENIWASVGIHPHDAGSFADLEQLEKLITHPKVIALGETGLDFYRDWAPEDRQHELFENTIKTAKHYKKPLIIHCRDAGEATLETLRRLGADEVGGVFHCYAEDAQFAEKLREINFRVSLTGNITFKKATALREAIAQIPLEQIMVETDCPYMAPEPFRGKPSEPMHVYQVAMKIAEIKGLTLEEVAEATTANAEKLFSLPQTNS